MRGLVETLDVQVTLVIEDGRKVVHARCIVGEGSWGLSANTKPAQCQGWDTITIVFYLYQLVWRAGYLLCSNRSDLSARCPAPTDTPGHHIYP
jgi:hypothetical protein